MMDHAPAPTPHPPVCAAPAPGFRPGRAHPTGHTRILVVALSTLLVVLVLVLAAAVAALVRGPSRHGSVSPVVRADTASGFWRLAVVYDDALPGFTPSAQVERSEHPGALSVDQEASFTRAWTAACLTWAELHVVAWDQAVVCALDADQRPQISSPGPTTGSSSDLVNALAFMDNMFDINGELDIAATGTLDTEILLTDSGHRTTAQVQTVAGSSYKAQAAQAAGVDLVVVPVDNAAEFRDQLGDRIPVVAAPSLAQAVTGICACSRTAFCLERGFTT